MSTFWERACATGDGASEPLDLNDFESAFALYGIQRITFPELIAWLGITQAQAEELNIFVMYTMPGPGGDDLGWFAKALYMRMLFHACRSGRPSLDSVANVWLALNYTPPDL